MWILVPLAFVLIVVTLGMYDRAGLSWKEMEALDEIQEQEDTARAERLRIAHERRKELGK